MASSSAAKHLQDHIRAKTMNDDVKRLISKAQHYRDTPISRERLKVRNLDPNVIYTKQHAESRMLEEKAQKLFESLNLHSFFYEKNFISDSRSRASKDAFHELENYMKYLTTTDEPRFFDEKIEVARKYNLSEQLSVLLEYAKMIEINK